MLNTERLTALIVALGCCALLACDDSSTTEPGPMVSDDMDSPPPAPDMGAPFNYIPLNDEACQIADHPVGVQQVAAEQIDELIAAGQHRVATQLKFCNEEAIAGCDFTCDVADNPMLELSRDFAGPLSEYVASVSNFDISDGLEAYIQDALAWPYRELVVSYIDCSTLPAGSCPADTNTRLVLTQGRRQRCDGTFGGCDHLSIEPESLDLQCQAFPMELYGALQGELDGAHSITAALPAEAEAADVNFGFVVPLTPEYPDAGANLSDEALLGWLRKLEDFEQTLEIRMEAFSVELVAGDDGAVCGRMSGRVPTSAFIDALVVEDEALAMVLDNLFSNYADPADPSRVGAQLAFKLDPAAFTNGTPCAVDPCTMTTVECLEGESVSISTVRSDCRLDGTAGMSDGDAVEVMCDVGGESRRYETQLDCADYGGTCGASGCSTDFATPEPGDLVFTELFIGDGEEDAYRSAQGEFNEQWIELLNATDGPLDLQGCVLKSAPSEYGPTRRLPPLGIIPLAAGERVVLSYTDDLGQNGLESTLFKYDWPIGMGDPDNEDRIAIFCGANLDLIDEVNTPAGWGITGDAAMRLSDSAATAAGNDTIEAWCEATEPFAEGRLGTPGAINGDCP